MPPPKQSPLAQIKAIENDRRVQSLIAQRLPPNYDFEIPKTIWRIRKNPNCKTVALQFPEGLLIFSTKIGSILTDLCGVDVILMGDITYGACCVDDHTASMLGADLLVHYGHSCLVPVAVANKVDTIYVFVAIKFNIENAATAISRCINEKVKYRANQVQKSQIQYEDESNKDPMNVSLVSTIQFANSLGELKQSVEAKLDSPTNLTIPRCKPLSNGEILGCTAPKIKADLIFYIGDGRFHLEAMMMANPGVEAYRYDPYNSTMTLEGFDHDALAHCRSEAVRKLKQSRGSKIGIILGTLGRQGNPAPMEWVYQSLKPHYSPFVLLMSEVMPAKLKLLENVHGFVQFACPRLSIDWGDAFHVPVITSYEATLLTNELNQVYSHPMDYYAYDSLGPHTPNHKV